MQKNETTGRPVRSSRALLAIPLVLALLPLGAHAVDFGTLVMPGPVIQHHADVETECSRCHQPFESHAQELLCAVCHEDVDADLRTGQGFHGHAPGISSAACRSCHSEHLGRDADIVGLVEETFDHALTDYPLEGAHRQADCAACHEPELKHREAPSECIACHRADDRHQGSMGEDCARCHGEKGWADTRFDHDRTEFRLEGGHAQTDCALCHPGEQYKETPTRCNACHALDDVHHGRYGDDCASCHGVQSWKQTAFDHDRRTDFPLLGRHRETDCTACHTSANRGKKLDTSCVSCHRPDDEHGGLYGNDCASCHGAAAWSRIRFDHGRDAKLALEGAHQDLACGKCHRGNLQTEKLDRSCAACHGDDDVHRGQLGESCGECHDQRAWSGEVAFDHDLGAFPLLGLHALSGCEDCHDGSDFRRTSRDCAECHRSQDVHQRRLGSACESCHNPNGWMIWRFDHDEQTSFALHGSHEGLDCMGCHRQPVKGEIRLAKSCESCHALDDPHRGSFGQRCGDCHVDRSWREVRFER